MWRWLRLPMVLGLLTWWSGPAGADFTEVAGAVGLDVGGPKEAGLVFADLNDDGFPDVLVNRSGGSRLFFSDGAVAPTFMEVTSSHAAGLLADTAERSAIAADLNNDGYVDIVRTQFDLVEVYLNKGPDASPPFSFGDDLQAPSFRLTSTDVPDLNPEGIGVLDVDNDGFLDVVGDFNGEVRFFVNPADGSAGFSMAPAGSFGLPAHDAAAPVRDGDYVVVTDFDLDGFVDIAHRNLVLPDLFRNDGMSNFETIATPDLDSSNDNKGGSIFCDFDGDGDFDYFFSDGEGTGINEVYVQSMPGLFVSIGSPGSTGTTVDGVDCGDVDNDGDIDLFLTRQTGDQLYLNQLAESGTFAWRQDNLGITGSPNGEGTVLVDFDRDGDLDVYINQTGPNVTDPMTMMTMRTGADNQLWQNDTNDAAYLMVRVLAEVQSCTDGAIVRRDDIGATLTLEHVDSGWLGLREVNGGKGHGTQQPATVHFGLPEGADATYQLTVRFQHGSEPDATIAVTPSDLGAYQLLEVVATDPDGDTIPTSVEMADAGADADPDGDGIPAWLDPDSDGDGTTDLIEAGDNDPCTAPNDTDDTGTPDYLESGADSDGDTVVDSADRDPDDPMICADSDADTCDDCSVAGRPETDNDGPDADADGTCDAGEPPDAGMGTDGGLVEQAEVHGSGCVECAIGRPTPSGVFPWVLVVAALISRLRRRRKTVHRGS